MKISSLLVLFTILYSLTGYTDATTQKNTENISVEWYKNFAMPSMLSIDFKVKTFADIHKILNMKWYSKFTVVEASKPDILISISTCHKYFTIADKNIYSMPEWNNAALMYITIQCQATKIISDGAPSKKSFLKNIKFDANLPNKLPPQMAQIISTEQSKRILANKKITSWAQADSILKTKKLDSYQTKYFIEGGAEVLQLVAKGDFNHDGIEDMLLIIKDAVEGGSYSATRLFLLTRLTDGGKIKLLQQWPKEE